MTYGLPDSIVVGTTRRVYKAVSKKTRGELRQDINWVWGWAGMAGLWLLGHIVVAISKLF